MDPLHPMSFWHLLARLDFRVEGEHKKNLSIEYGFPSGTRLMGILHIHLMIYSPECSIHQSTIVYPILFLQNPND